MTDDEIREALRLDFEQTADWRRSKAAEYPEDSRNLEAAALLDKLAASVETVPITVSPSNLAHCETIRPTPPAAACSSTVSPALNG